MRRSSRKAPAQDKAPEVQETLATQEAAEVSLTKEPEAKAPEVQETLATQEAAEVSLTKEPEAKAEKDSVIGEKKLVTLITPYQKVHPKTGTRFFPNDAVPHEVDAWILAMKDAECFTITDLPSE